MASQHLFLTFTLPFGLPTVKNRFLVENKEVYTKGILDMDVLDALCAIRNINDVFACPFIRKENRISFLKSFQKAKRTNSPRALLTQGLTRPLIACKGEDTFGHAFDATPLHGLVFAVSPDRSVSLQPKMGTYEEYINKGANTWYCGV